MTKEAHSNFQNKQSEMFRFFPWLNAEYSQIYTIHMWISDAVHKINFLKLIKTKTFCLNSIVLVPGR